MSRRKRLTTQNGTSNQNGSAPKQDPAIIRDSTDPGDDTQQRFRYQHAYGVILLVAATRGERPYKALWCEHHEDFLGEREDGLWDGFQIKTQRPENGDWHLQKDALRNSLKRFVILDQRFPGKINELHFVTNCEFMNSDAEENIAKSPVKFFKAVRSVESVADLPQPFAESFEVLRKHCDCPADTLLLVLKKVKLIVGPALAGFDAELTQNHLSHLPECTNLPVPVLKALRDELVSLIYRASSLPNEDPARHWHCVLGTDTLDPVLQEKKVLTARLIEVVKQRHNVPFRYLPGSGYLDLGNATQNTMRLYKKMARGGIAGQFEVMRSRALSAEGHLLGLVHLAPERFDATLNQIVNVVIGECSEAQLQAEGQGEPYGRTMLLEVYRRLREVAYQRPEMVERQPYECLVGVAGLLSGECKVWWSERFDLEDAA